MGWMVLIQVLYCPVYLTREPLNVFLLTGVYRIEAASTGVAGFTNKKISSWGEKQIFIVIKNVDWNLYVRKYFVFIMRGFCYNGLCDEELTKENIRK